MFFRVSTYIPLLALVACGGKVSLEPPVVHYGEDVCAQCQMIVNEHRFAAATVVDDRGAIEKKAFDDLGCLVEFEKSYPDLKVLAHYVGDFESEQWLPLENASIVRSENIQSPMGFGLLAVTPGSAQALKERFQGEILNYRQLSTPEAAADEAATPNDTQSGEL